jgi:hypothetical protein
MMIKLITAMRWSAGRPAWVLVPPLFLATVLAAVCSNGPDGQSHDSAPDSPGSPGRPIESSRPAASAGTSTPQPGAGEVPINIITGGTVITARLADNATAHDFAALLPLTLTFTDFNRVEKIAKLPQPLSMEGAQQETILTSAISATTHPRATWSSTTATSATGTHRPPRTIRHHDGTDRTPRRQLPGHDRTRQITSEVTEAAAPLLAPPQKAVR